MKGAGTSTVKIYDFLLKKYAHLKIQEPREAMKQLEKATTPSGRQLSPSYIKGILSSIIWKIRQEDPENPILEEYRYIIAHIRGQLEREARGHKKISGYIPPWEEIIKIREDELKKGNMKNHLILSLYTYNPPRRILDYVMLKIAKDPAYTQDERYNYYVLSKKIFIFNVYKTAKTHKQQIIEVPKVLSDIIYNYIKSNHEISNGDLLLGFHSYLQLNYVLKKLLGCGVDNVRHSYTNYAYKEFNIPTNEYMSDLAYKMGHNVETNLLYRKF